MRWPPHSLRLRSSLGCRCAGACIFGHGLSRSHVRGQPQFCTQALVRRVEQSCVCVLCASSARSPILFRGVLGAARTLVSASVPLHSVRTHMRRLRPRVGSKPRASPRSACVSAATARSAGSTDSCRTRTQPLSTTSGRRRSWRSRSLCSCDICVSLSLSLSPRVCVCVSRGEVRLAGCGGRDGRGLVPGGSRDVGC